MNKSNEVKYLGLYLDNKLTWKRHVEHINEKINTMIPSIYKVKDIFNFNTKLKIYHAYFLPILTYLIPIWGTGYHQIIHKVQILQNKILKILFNQNYLTHTSTLYEKLGLKQIGTILKVEQSKLIYKILNGKQKTNSILTFTNSVHNHNTRKCNNIFTNFSRTNLANFNPIKDASKTFNNLPDNLKTINNYVNFKSKLKTFKFTDS